MAAFIVGFLSCAVLGLVTLAVVGGGMAPPPTTARPEPSADEWYAQHAAQVRAAQAQVTAVSRRTQDAIIAAARRRGAAWPPDERAE